MAVLVLMAAAVGVFAAIHAMIREMSEPHQPANKPHIIDYTSDFREKICVRYLSEHGTKREKEARLLDLIACEG